MKAGQIQSRFLIHISCQVRFGSGTHCSIAAFDGVEGVMHLPRFCLVAFLLSAHVAAAEAQTNTPEGGKGAFSLLFENDLFDNTDHDYTNGVELGYTTAPDGTPEWAVDAARALPFFGEGGGDVRTRYAIGQAM